MHLINGLNFIKNFLTSIFLYRKNLTKKNFKYPNLIES